MTEEYEFPVPDDHAGLNLTHQEIVELRKSKKELTDYGREKLRKMMKEQQIQKRKSKTIRDIIEQWWMDTFTSKNKWSVDTAIEDLADQIQLWIIKNKENLK